LGVGVVSESLGVWVAGDQSSSDVSGWGCLFGSFYANNGIDLAEMS